MFDMQRTRYYVICMSNTIQIRNVPEDLHRRIKSRAALLGLSLSDYLLGQIREIGERPTMEEMRARLASRTPVNSDLSPAEMIREERDRV
jgi:plasmid stability protein